LIKDISNKSTFKYIKSRKPVKYYKESIDHNAKEAAYEEKIHYFLHCCSFWEKLGKFPCQNKKKL